jgi:hypothetical protein
MKVIQKGHTSILKETEASINDFIEKISNQYTTFEKQNLILDISNYSIQNKEMALFEKLAKLHKKAKKSFIIVTNSVDFELVPKYLVVVPTVLEAHDMIEMDEIERDLGF